MNRFHSILFMVILAFVSSALAVGNNSFAVAILRQGTYDVATVDGEGKYAIGCMWSMAGMVLVVILENIWVLLLEKIWIAKKKKIYGF